MTSIIKLQSLSGAQDESHPCYLLQVDEFRFLLDCGWDEDFSTDFMEELKRHIPTVDAVLLSYPDHAHLGALPHLVGKCGLTCPIYATIPVYKMGQMFMYDLYQSRHNSEEFDIFTLDDVDAAFDKIIQLKYSQTVSLKGKGHGLQITPLAAGHMLGGTIWKIVKDGEEEIIYAIDYNHKKERHLNGCVLETLNRPSLMITDSYNATYVQSRRRIRDEQLMTTILKTMRNDGNVLVAVDTAGRMLELVQLLDQMWRSAESGLAPYSLALLNNVCFNVVEFAKSQVEWMSDKIMRAFEENRNNPYHFKHVKSCHNLAELSRVPEPKVVLSSVPDLQCGFSRDLFVSWCGNPKNSIILTTRTSPGTLTRWLIDNPDKKKVTMENLRPKVCLSKFQRTTYSVSKHKFKGTEAKRFFQEPPSDGVSRETDFNSPLLSHFLGIHHQGKARTSFFKQTKKAYPMFPHIEEKIKWDEYGEIIKPEDYTIVEATAVEEEMVIVSIILISLYTSEVPTKCVSTTVTLDINANLQYIDFEGRSDGESIRKIIAQIKPRYLIIVRGTKESTQALSDYCKNTQGFIQGQIFTPAIGEVVDATRERHIYQVRLKDYLVSALNFSKAKDIELAWIDGGFDLSASKTDTSAMYEPEDGEITDKDGKKVKTDKDNSTDDSIATLEALPEKQVVGHKAVFINEPKLSDFKLVLLQEGFQAEFIGGVLICNNQVAVRRNEAGRIQLEGTVCEDYFRIRTLLYQQYAIV
ncbi:hypothetical protein ScPMuIL_014954 [Solemya velum]